MVQNNKKTEKTEKKLKTDLNREIMAFQLLVLFSFVLESVVFHEEEFLDKGIHL